MDTIVPSQLYLIINLHVVTSHLRPCIRQFPVSNLGQQTGYYNLLRIPQALPGKRPDLCQPTTSFLPSRCLSIHHPNNDAADSVVKQALSFAILPVVCHFSAHCLSSCATVSF